MEQHRYHEVLGQIQADREPTALGDYVHDLLRDTARYSIAENQVPELVGMAVATGVWSVQDALDIAARIADPERKTHLYTALLSIDALNEAQRHELETASLKLLEQIEFEQTRFYAALRLIPHLHEGHKRVLLEQALDLALRLDSGDQRFFIHAVWTLAPLLPEALAFKAAEQVSKISHPESRAWAWAGLARRIHGESKGLALARGVDAALAIPEELQRANALAQLGDQLTGESLTRALEATLAIQNENWQPRVIAELACNLSEEQMAITLKACLAIQHPWYRAYALAGLIPYVSGDLLEQGLKAALSSESEEAQALILGRVDLPDEYLPRALELALAIKNVHYRFQALLALFRHLTDEHKQQLLDEVMLRDRASIPYRYPGYILRLAQELDEMQGQRLLLQALEDIPNIPDEEDRSGAFVPLIDALPESLLPRALEISLAFDIDTRRAYVLGALAKRLPADLVQRALTKLATVHEDASCTFALTGLACHLGRHERAEILDYAWQSATAIQPVWERVEPLSRLLPLLEEGQGRVEAVAYTLDVVRALPGAQQKAPMLAALMPFLGDSERTNAFDLAYDLAQKIDPEYQRADALVALAEQAADETKGRILTQALEAASNVPVEADGLSGSLRTAAIAKVASQAGGEILTEALNTLQRENPAPWDIMMVLKRPFTPQQYAMVVEMVTKLKGKGWRAKGLAMLSQHDHTRRAEMLAQAVELAKEEPRPYRKFESLLALAGCLEGQQQAEVVQLGIEVCASLDPEYRSVSLSKWLPFVKEPAPLIRQIRGMALETLQSFQNGPRAAVLNYLGNQTIFAPPIFSPSTLTVLAKHIIELCVRGEAAGRSA